MKILTMLLFVAFSFTAYSAEDFYSLSATKINGDNLNFSELKGKKILIVNVASLCGYTPQYEYLQSLYMQFGGGNKFEILGFPTNDFGGQEPGADSTIDQFCRENYDVTFQMMSKITVVGAEKHPVYQWLTLMSKNGVKDQEVLWNFQKYLIDENGKYVEVLSSATSPLDPKITNWLSTPSSVDDNISNNLFTISPNPSSDFIEISLSNKGLQPFAEDVKVQIFNTLGIEVSSAGGGRSEVDGGGFRIDISNLNAGVYFIKVGDRVEKFVKM
jgi:glutathione peroxidase